MRGGMTVQVNSLEVMLTWYFDEITTPELKSNPEILCTYVLPGTLRYLHESVNIPE